MRMSYVLYVSSAGSALWIWQRDRFVESPVKVAVDADPGPIVAELQRLPSAPIAVLVDMTDEEHARDAVPRVSRRDQQVLLARKLSRVFPRTPLRSAQIQGRSLANPDQDNVLISALTRPEPVRVLLQALAAAKLPVAGVYSPALLTRLLLDAELRTLPAVMLVLRRANGRLQHSFFLEGRLVGSRRLRAVALPGPEDPAVMSRQIEESLRYFDPTFSARTDRPLRILLEPQDAALMKDAGPPHEGWHPHALDTPAICKRLKIVDHGHGITEHVFIELLRRHAEPPGFAQPGDSRYFEHYRVRTWARAACVALGGIGLAGALYNVLFLVDANRRIAEFTSTVQQLETVLPSADQNVQTGVDPLQMQQAVSAYDTLVAREVAPERVLDVIGAAMTRRPRIQLDSIQWAAEASAADAMAGATIESTEPDESDASADAAVTPAGDDVTITLKGRVAPFGGDYPLAFRELDAFTALLRANPAIVSVRATQQPLDVDPASTLSGEFSGTAAEADAPFTLQIVMKRNHG